MSIPAFAWARERGRELKLSAPERWLLVVLADRANGKLFCWPSIGQLMDDTGLARQTILTVVHTLARIGLIRIEKRGRGHEYHVLRPADRSKSDTDQQSKSRPQEASASVQNKTDDRSKSGPTNGLDRSKNRSRSVQIRYSNRSKSDTLTLKETKKEPLRAREAPPVRDAPPQPPEGAGDASTSAAANGAAPQPETPKAPSLSTPVGSELPHNALRALVPFDPAAAEPSDYHDRINKAAALKMPANNALASDVPTDNQPIGPIAAGAVIASTARALRSSLADNSDIRTKEILKPMQVQKDERTPQQQAATILAACSPEQWQRAQQAFRERAAL